MARATAQIAYEIEGVEDITVPVSVSHSQKTQGGKALTSRENDENITRNQARVILRQHRRDGDR